MTETKYAHTDYPAHVPPNEIKREFLGVVGLNPLINTVASARVQMASSQIGQHVDIAGARPPYIKSGMELEYGKTTFSIKMPRCGKILKIMDLYPKLHCRDFHDSLNPVTYVLYETLSENTKLDGSIGLITLPKMGSQHQHFGYRYTPGPAYHKIRPGAVLMEGDVLLQTTSVDPVTEEYMFGAQCNVAFMSHPAVAEDGIAISEEARDIFRFKMQHTRVVEWGSSSYALPIYSFRRPDGVIVNKVFPDIGDLVRPDGLLMVIRRLDDYHNLTELDTRGLTEVNPYMDESVYALSPVGDAVGRVVDIRVYNNAKNAPSCVPRGLDDQPEEYFKARQELVGDLKQEYLRLMRMGKKKMLPEFRQMLREAISIGGMPRAEGRDKPEAIKILHRKSPLDTWRVEFTIEFDVPAYVGSKLTGLFGDKGVVVKILPKEQMPVDEAGNRALIIMDGESTVNRMNPGRLYLSYLNGASRDVLQKVKEELELSGFEMTDQDVEGRLRRLDATSPVVRSCWGFMSEFYRTVSDNMRKWVDETEIDYVKHIAIALLERAIGRKQCEPLDLYFPTDDQVFLPSMVEELQKNFPQTYGPVTFEDEHGVKHTSKENVRIASSYVMLLEKIADDWAAIASGKLQHHGMLSKITSVDKYATPARESATRILGEAEVRLNTAYIGPNAVAEILDRSTNPNTHKSMYRKLLKAPNPSAIENIVDRDEIPLGADKPGQLIKHIAEIGGWKFVYGPDE
jgi:hypothetical protein